MNDIKRIICKLYSTVECVSGEELMTTLKDDFDVSPMNVAMALASLEEDGGITIEGDGLSMKSKTIKFVDGFVLAPEVPVASPTVPAQASTPVRAKRSAPNGITRCVNWKGEEYDYYRSTFDGPETQLDEEHQIMKEELMTFKDVVRKIFKNCNGIGKDAITMYEPQNPHANKDGKVFYRWDNGNGYTVELMDKMYEAIYPVIEAYKTKMEAIQGE